MLSQWDARDVVSHLDTKRNLSKRNVQMNLQKLMDTSYRKTLVLKLSLRVMTSVISERVILSDREEVLRT